MRPMPTDLYDQPEIEYLDGRPRPKVSPRLTHAIVQTAAARVLGDCAGDRGVVVCELRVAPQALGASSTEFVPDIAYIANERLAQLSAEEREKPPFSPDIAVEVRSPSDDLQYVARKITRYLATGSVLVIDVDPQRRCIEAHTREGMHPFSATESFALPAVPWLQFDVRQLFAGLNEQPQR